MRGEFPAARRLLVSVKNIGHFAFCARILGTSGFAMRKFAITSLAVLYAVLILSVSAKRSSDWVERQADTLSTSSCGSNSPVMTKAVDADTRLRQKKRVEGEFVVEAPREAVLIPILNGQYLPFASFQILSPSSGQRFLSRAPPSYS